MDKEPFSLTYSYAKGLSLTWDAGNGIVLHEVPIRLRIYGYNVFYVWNNVQSGEGPPVWAEKNLDLTLFAAQMKGTGQSCHVDRMNGPHFIATALNNRAQARLEIYLRNGRINFGFSLNNPQACGGRPLPVCKIELSIGELNFGPHAEFLSAHAYGGRTHGAGKLENVPPEGLPFTYGCLGLALPLVYLHNPDLDAGLEMEFMLQDRPTAWLRQDKKPGTLKWCLEWTPDRLLDPGEQHVCEGEVRLRSFIGRAIVQMRKWRDTAGQQYKLKAREAPDWLRCGNMIEFNMNPANQRKGFSRLDNSACRRLMEGWREMGYTVIFAVSQFRTGKNWLSPFDYEPCDSVGGPSAERQFINWAHELGFYVILWITTVGIDSNAKEVGLYPDWFTHRPNGSLFYAWESAPPDFKGYAPDADPLSEGWRQWLKDQVLRIISRGYDGIFVDGCIPRASNHARQEWPGKGRNAVEDQVRELAEYVRTLGHDLVTFVEDETVNLQAACEMTMGRYQPITPFCKNAYWDHGMGGHPESGVCPPQRIYPEQARDYLLVRYASLLPGTTSNDIVEGYYSEESRPWTVQSLMCGIVPKTHSQYVDDPETFRSLPDAPLPSSEELEPQWRRLGTLEFLKLLKLRHDEPLVHKAPLSIEGVQVEGDAAVVGILRPGIERCLLILIQFANRPATVRVRLSRPVDVPANEQKKAGRPDMESWQVREIMHSMMDVEDSKEMTTHPSRPLITNLAPFGFRIFELIANKNTFNRMQEFAFRSL